MRGEILDRDIGGMWNPSRSPQAERVDECSPISDVRLTDAQYKDVVIVGNGPSAICLSYMLTGNWPYYGEAAHPIEFLHQRLDVNRSKSLLLQDLQFLCEGLEGRSNNPVSVLFDTLNHPDADLGVEAPSFLRWIPHRDQLIDHVVLGKGPPGGAWQTMEKSALTLSLSNWMELPNLSYKEWEQERLRDRSSGGRQSRAVVGNVARYYSDYVKYQQLDQYFNCYVVVTSVGRSSDRDGRDKTGDDPGAECYACGDGISREDRDRKPDADRSCWEVRGYSLWDQVPFRYITRNLVLATGCSDQPNRLEIPGEDLSFVLHSLSRLERSIVEQRLGPQSDPIMIVGAGLTAADAIITARFYGVPIAHVFRRDVDDPSLIFNKLPENMYPEYHKVHQMMMNGSSVGCYKGYQSYPKSHLVEMLPGNKVRMEGPDSSLVLSVSYALILIGSKPDLSFLTAELEDSLRTEPSVPIDGKRNLIRVDAFTHECVKAEGLYAIGPLVGDNFVRFLQGGGLAVASHLVRQRNRATEGRFLRMESVERRLGELRTQDGGSGSVFSQPHPHKKSQETADATRIRFGSWKSWQEEVQQEDDDSTTTTEGNESDESEILRRWKRRVKRRQLRRRRSSRSGCDKTSVG